MFSEAKQGTGLTGSVWAIWTSGIEFHFERDERRRVEPIAVSANTPARRRAPWIELRT